MKRLIQRVAALTAALCVAAACVAPVYAETANTEKEENVYVTALQVRIMRYAHLQAKKTRR